MKKISLLIVISLFYSCKDRDISHNNLLKKIPKVATIHGKILTDNYYWLRDRDNPNLLEFLENENSLINTYMNGTDSIQRKIFDEILMNENENYEGLPYEENGYWYQTKRIKGKDFPVSFRWKDNDENVKKVFFDENELVKKMSVKEVNKESISKDNRFLAFNSDKTGSGELDMRILDLQTNKVLDDVLEKGWQIEWLNDSKTLYYTKDDSITNRTYRLYKHLIGQPQSKDVLVYEEKDEAFSLGISKSRSESYIFLNSYSKDENQIWLLNADEASNDTVLIQKMEPKVKYSIDHIENYFFSITNKDAPNNKIIRTSKIRNGSPANWQEFVPENKEIYIESFILFKDYTVVEEKTKGLTKFHVFDNLVRDNYYIEISEDSYLMDVAVNKSSNSNTFNYTIESFSKPLAFYEWDFLERKTTIKKTTKPKHYKENEYKAEQVWARSSDGTEIPISLVYKKKLFSKNGNNPLIIEGYGSFGLTFNPKFDSWLFPLLDRGFVYARPHVRGGGYLGTNWYKDGKYLKKKNTFTDFIDCTEYLIKEKYTNKDQIVARGASAGGLLMGAVVNMKPQLYKTVIAEVPFLDVVNTMMDETIPLTTSEYKEWGNPKNKEYFNYMLSYSPYDNIHATSYPTMLFSTGYLDENAPYWEAAKTVAKMKEIGTGINPIFLKTNMKDGHQGPSGLYPGIEEEAYFQSFILKSLFPEQYN